RLLEVLGGHAAVALENARLFESQRREAEHLKELLEFSRELASAEGLPEVLRRVVELTATILGTPTTSVWLQDSDGKLAPAALWGYGNGRRERLVGVGLDPADIGELADRTEPFLLEHDVVAAIEGASEVELGAKYAVAP